MPQASQDPQNASEDEASEREGAFASLSRISRRLRWPQLSWLRAHWLPLALVSLVLCVLGAFVVDELLAHGLPHGTRLLGLDCGHWDEVRAKRALEPLARALEKRVLKVEIDGKTLNLVPEEAGVRIDLSATLSQAAQKQRSRNLARRFGAWFTAFFGPARATPAVVAIDAERLEARLSELERASVTLPFHGGFRVEHGRIVPEYPREGRRLPRARAGAELTAALQKDHASVTLATERAPAEVSSAAIDRLVANAAGLVAADVILVDAESGHSLTLRAAELTPALRVVPAAHAQPQIEFDSDALSTVIADRRASVESEARSAEFLIESGDRVRIVPSQKEVRIANRLFGEAVLAAARAPSRTAPLPLESLHEPELTTAQAQALSIRGLVSQFSTRHPCCERRVENIHHIADLLNRMLVKPGETVSLNARVGPRTAKNGFVPAPTIEEGEMVESIGGGISQFATTFFNALFHGGYEIIERQPHSYWFPRYPMGHEATLSYPKPDLIFKNDTAAGMLFDISYTNTTVTVRIFGDNGGRRVEARVSARQQIVQPTLEIIGNPSLPSDKEHTVQAGMIGWSVIVARIVTFPDGTKKEERRKVTYKPKPRRVEVHPCRLPKGEKGYTGEPCPEPPPEAEELVEGEGKGTG